VYVNIFNRVLNALLTHILSVCIFQLGVSQQLYGWACWCWTRG